MHIIKLEITQVLPACRVCIQLIQAGEGVWSKGRQVWAALSAPAGDHWVPLGGEGKPLVLR